MTKDFYPPSPKSLPANFTELPASYKYRAILAIAAIILFFILYLSMVVGLAALTYWTIIYPIEYVNKFTIMVKIFAVAGSAMLLFFTVKFIFKLKNVQPNNRLPLLKGQNPELEDFIKKICAETGAPLPKDIYVDPDVNAYVSYTNTWQSLFLPTKKNLTIGMGLIDCVNLTEFKAIVAHEFGHFAQRSMKIGSYIHSANTIIHDMIFTRDGWDDILANWRASDLRLSLPAWIISPIVWLIRQLLGLFYKFLNIMHSSLSREMEFNADKVAVKAAGSEAILSGLWKLDPGSTTWNETVSHAFLASKKGYFVNNLYAHNAQELKRNAANLHQKRTELPKDANGNVHFFMTSEVSKAGMYASHPPNDHRESNAKKPFIPCETDERSPWFLFGDPTDLQAKMTKLIYRTYLDLKPKDPVEDVVFEDFIKSERAGKELLSEYHDTFEHRFMYIPQEEELTEISALPTLNQLKSNLREIMQPIWDIDALMLKAQKIAEGNTAEKSFTYSGDTFTKKRLQEGYNKLLEDRELIFNENFKDWDASFCRVHYTLAKEQGKLPQLLKAYNQHRAITLFYKLLVATKVDLMQRLAELQKQDEVQIVQLESYTNKTTRLLTAANDELQTFDKLDFVTLPNIETKEELVATLLDGGPFRTYKGNMFETGAFDRLLQKIDTSLGNCQRLDQKSIGSILTFHHELAEK
ncbi:MAG: Zn-dependent protease with chaperone function [Bacteroidia bacterium]|jgi:Zn-dependent protease with chaperone function